MSEVHFRVSSGLKSIIGRELITNDLVAIFELVKNSFDARATRVDIRFDKLGTDAASLTIKDNGKGMDAKDIRDKWLFVAYSAKKEGLEDYRDKIKSKRHFAGAKGIGRFACDRLGSKLELLARRNKLKPITRLEVDWSAFEVKAEKEFVDISANLSTTKIKLPSFGVGTILRITELREGWDRSKLLSLKHSLEKLVNPSQGSGENKFSIRLQVPGELKEDQLVPAGEPWGRVNGPLENFIFESLKIKTTNIRVTVSSEGDTIETILEDRGRFIYRTVEKNPYNINGVMINLFALNRRAKAAFTKHMGVQPVRYGSVFLFKNGFRVFPFGEEKDDRLGIDRRKQQGHARFLGTRDLLGRIEIQGRNPGFVESTSRDGGLIRNSSTEQLEDLFFQYALKRLERFAIGVIKFGNRDIPSGEVRSKTLELILSLVKAKSLLDIEYGDRVIDVLREASSKSLGSVVSNFRKLAEESGSSQLLRDAKRAEKRIDELQQAREEAENETNVEREARAEAEEDARAQAIRASRAEKLVRKEKARTLKSESQNMFLQSVVSADVDGLLGMHHHIGIAAGTIQNYARSITKRIRSGKPVSTEMFLDTLEKISLQARQIESSTRFATKAGFDTKASKISADIISFVREYVMNVCNGMVFDSQGRALEIEWKRDTVVEVVRTFRPLEVVVLVDNLISNARKAGARKIQFSAEADSESRARIHIADNGSGIKDGDKSKIFGLGYTRTDGAGFGLHHARKIAEDLGGTLVLQPGAKVGAEFVWQVVE